jgi:hypothetical protein
MAQSALAGNMAMRMAMCRCIQGIGAQASDKSAETNEEVSIWVR